LVEAEALKHLIPQVLEYVPETGEMRWRFRDASLFEDKKRRSAEHCASNWNARHAGQEAFTTIGGHGYRSGRLQGHGLLLHRVAFVLMTGDWPKALVDHIDGDRLNNRWNNLREASSAQNVRNRRGFSRTSPYVGVCWNKALQGYMARVYCGGVVHYCGFSKDDPEKLARRRDQKAQELFGSYAHLNFPVGV
jgi:hypothetical protein